ncbi:MAG: hypothetical protein PHY72_01295 [Candidatus Pacebacteria bacterium]|nr:hypothetical protein [Candidatus Paceibacterota bacterium]
MANGQTATISLSEQKLKTLIKESVREGIKAEILKLRVAFLSYVDNAEQKEIEKKYGKPSRKVAKTYECEI